MGALCLSAPTILRCESFTAIQNQTLLIPTAIELLATTFLLYTNRHRGRRHLLITFEGWSYAALALLEMLSHILPAAREDAGVFKILDTILAALSLVPMILFMSFLYLLSRSELIPILPRRLQRLLQLLLLLFIPVVVALNIVSGFIGISHRVINTGPDSVLAIGFATPRDSTLWSFFTSLTLALYTAFQALAWILLFYRLMRALASQRRIETADQDSAHFFRGTGWLNLGVKMGVIESVIGFAIKGGHGMALTRRIGRAGSRVLLCVGIAKGMDYAEDFQKIREEMTPKNIRRLSRSSRPLSQISTSRLRQLISNPRLSTFRQLSPTATAFHRSASARVVAAGAGGSDAVTIISPSEKATARSEFTSPIDNDNKNNETDDTDRRRDRRAIDHRFLDGMGNYNDIATSSNSNSNGRGNDSDSNGNNAQADSEKPDMRAFISIRDRHFNPNYGAGPAHNQGPGPGLGVPGARVTVLARTSQGGAPTLHMRLSDLMLPSPATVVDHVKAHLASGHGHGRSYSVAEGELSSAVSRSGSAFDGEGEEVERSASGKGRRRRKTIAATAYVGIGEERIRDSVVSSVSGILAFPRPALVKGDSNNDHSAEQQPQTLERSSSRETIRAGQEGRPKLRVHTSSSTTTTTSGPLGRTQSQSSQHTTLSRTSSFARRKPPPPLTIPSNPRDTRAHPPMAILPPAIERSSAAGPLTSSTHTSSSVLESEDDLRAEIVFSLSLNRDRNGAFGRGGFKPGIPSGPRPPASASLAGFRHGHGHSNSLSDGTFLVGSGVDGSAVPPTGAGAGALDNSGRRRPSDASTAAPTSVEGHHGHNSPSKTGRLHEHEQYLIVHDDDVDSLPPSRASSPTYTPLPTPIRATHKHDDDENGGINLPIYVGSREALVDDEEEVREGLGLSRNTTFGGEVDDRESGGQGRQQKGREGQHGGETDRDSASVYSTQTGEDATTSTSNVNTPSSYRPRTKTNTFGETSFPPHPRPTSDDIAISVEGDDDDLEQYYGYAIGDEQDERAVMSPGVFARSKARASSQIYPGFAAPSSPLPPPPPPPPPVPVPPVPAPAATVVPNASESQTERRARGPGESTSTPARKVIVKVKSIGQIAHRITPRPIRPPLELNRGSVYVQPVVVPPRGPRGQAGAKVPIKEIEGMEVVRWKGKGKAVDRESRGEVEAKGGKM